MVNSKENIIQEKTLAFAIRIVKLTQFLCKEKNEFVLSKQILRAGTSIGASVREAEYAQSKKDFINKISIALKEAAETNYWLLILKETNYISVNQYENIHKDAEEIIKLLTSIIISSKKNLNDEKARLNKK